MILATYKPLNILQTNYLSVGCINCLYIRLHTIIEILQTTNRLWVVHALGVVPMEETDMISI
jgi:hypothetical protein